MNISFVKFLQIGKNEEEEKMLRLFPESIMMKNQS